MSSKARLVNAIVLSRVKWEHYNIQPRTKAKLMRLPKEVLVAMADYERRASLEIPRGGIGCRVTYKMLNCLPTFCENTVRAMRKKSELVDIFVALSRALRQIPLRSPPYAEISGVLLYVNRDAYASVHLTNFKNVYANMHPDYDLYNLLLDSGCKDALRRDILFTIKREPKGTIFALLMAILKIKGELKKLAT